MNAFATAFSIHFPRNYPHRCLSESSRSKYIILSLYLVFHSQLRIAKKRGRPISILGDDLAIVRRREKTAERVRRYLERKRATHQNQIQEDLVSDTHCRDACNVSHVGGEQLTVSCPPPDLRPSPDIPTAQYHESNLNEGSAGLAQRMPYLDSSVQEGINAQTRMLTVRESYWQTSQRDTIDLERRHESGASEAITVDTPTHTFPESPTFSRVLHRAKMTSSSLQMNHLSM